MVEMLEPERSLSSEATMCEELRGCHHVFLQVCISTTMVASEIIQVLCQTKHRTCRTKPYTHFHSRLAVFISFLDSHKLLCVKYLPLTSRVDRHRNHPLPNSATLENHLSPRGLLLRSTYTTAQPRGPLSRKLDTWVYQESIRIVL